MFRPLLAANALLLAAGSAQSVPLAPDFDNDRLARTDDGFIAAQALGFSVNLYGISYGSAFVSNNGYLTFGAGQEDYATFGIGADDQGRPIVAPFFPDVDTRNPASGSTGHGRGSFAGRDAFGATWPGVGYYDTRADKLNSFQGILVERSDVAPGNFDTYFLYAQVQFERGDFSKGISAAVGYSNGAGAAGTFAQLPGSLVNGASLDGDPNSLTAGSLGTGAPGQYLFQVRGGSPNAPARVAEPASTAVPGFSLVLLGVLRRR